MKSKKLVNRLLSVLMAVIMTIGLIPMGSVTVKAETKNATLSNLGELGTVKIGNKSESGTWYQTEVAGTPVVLHGSWKGMPCRGCVCKQ